MHGGSLTEAYDLSSPGYWLFQVASGIRSFGRTPTSAPDYNPLDNSHDNNPSNNGTVHNCSNGAEALEYSNQNSSSHSKGYMVIAPTSNPLKHPRNRHSEITSHSNTPTIITRSLYSKDIPSSPSATLDAFPVIASHSNITSSGAGTIGLGSGTARWQCSQCNKTFTSRYGLHQHEEAHRGIYKYACRFCEKGFQSTTNLKEHTYNHTHVKEFLCSECGDAFRYARALREHVRSKHPKLSSSRQLWNSNGSHSKQAPSKRQRFQVH